jgi:hypothetical protein
MNKRKEIPPPTLSTLSLFCFPHYPLSTPPPLLDITSIVLQERCDSLYYNSLAQVKHLQPANERLVQHHARLGSVPLRSHQSSQHTGLNHQQQVIIFVSVERMNTMLKALSSLFKNMDKIDGGKWDARTLWQVLCFLFVLAGYRLASSSIFSRHLLSFPPSPEQAQAQIRAPGRPGRPAQRRLLRATSLPLLPPVPLHGEVGSDLLGIP